MNWLVQVGAGLGGLTFLGTLITALALWRKNGADAASVLTDRALRAATTSIGNLEKNAEQLSLQLERTTGELRALRRHMVVLEGLLRQSGVSSIPEFDWPPHRNGVA